MSKGFDYEREMAKLFSLWWSGGERDDIFWRTSGSGGRHTNRRKRNKDTANAAGDLSCSHPSGESFIRCCVVEFKRGYTGVGRIYKTDLIRFIQNNWQHGVNRIADYMIKYIRNKLKKTGDTIDPLDIVDSDKRNILIDWYKKTGKEATENGRKYSFVVFKRDMKQTCIMMGFNIFWKFIGDPGETEINYIEFHYGKYHSLMVIRLEDFFKLVKPVQFQIEHKRGV